MRDRRERAREAGAGGMHLAVLIAIGIGLHNLGEGLLIGSAYAAGALALGAFLVVGFAIHNTTEGLAIVAPLSRTRASLGRLAGLGLIAGAPAVLGAWIGASLFNPSLVSLLFGAGIGAIVQVVVQIWPSLRPAAGSRLDGTAFAGLLGGAVAMYATGLLIGA
jgi:zinc transporter ZupT